jgi:hypothetical protein
MAKAKKATVPVSIPDWGQNTPKQALSGYIARGDFAKDLERFFPDEERVGTQALDPTGNRLETLPAGARPAAEALDALVRTGTTPFMGHACSFEAYGFDCVKNELYGADEATYFGLAYDGFGDMYLLDLTTGAVLFYSHEEGTLEEGFDSLDTFAFAMSRVDAALKGRIAKHELEASFERLGLSARGLSDD